MKVGVVGMGAAGIYSARLLEKARVEVECFEARDRVGGRLLTVSGTNGEPIDAGGEWIDSDHFRVLGLAKDLGASLDANPRPPGRVYFRGEWAPEYELWRGAIADETRFEARAEELVNSLPEKKNEVTGRNLQSLIDETAQTDVGRFWLAAKLRSDEGEDPDRIGLLGWLEFYRKYLDRTEPSMSSYRIKDGLGTLLKRASERLKCPIHFGHRISKIECIESEVVCRFVGSTVRSFDYVVVALPTSVLIGLDIQPELPMDVWQAQSKCRMGRSIKVAIEYKEPWWLDMDWNGSLHSDTVLQQVWAAPGNAPVLIAYVCGSACGDPTQADNPIHDLGQVLADLIPESKDHRFRARFFDWTSDWMSGGGFPHLAPECSIDDWHRAYAPHGRVHFAGDWAASWIGFVEGALESAERAVGEILNA